MYDIKKISRDLMGRSQLKVYQVIEFMLMYILP